MRNDIKKAGFLCSSDQQPFRLLTSVKANLHWGVARSSRVRFFVCFIAPRSCRARAQNYPTQQSKESYAATPGNSSV